MGKGSLYYKEKEVIFAIGSNKKTLSCGCSATRLLRVVNSQGEPVIEELDDSFHIEKYKLEIISFQSEEWTLFWNTYYKENPCYKPILVDNKL